MSEPTSPEHTGRQLRVSSVPSCSYSSKSWLETVFGMNADKDKNSEPPCVIHLLGGSFVLDFSSNNSSGESKGEEMKKVRKKSVKEEKKEIVTTSFEANPTVSNWETLMKMNAEEKKLLNKIDDEEGMNYMVIGVTIFSIVSYIGHIISDLATSGILFHRGQYLWASLSLAFTILPIIAINAASLIWYRQNSLYRESLSSVGWYLRIFAHCVFMGMICRNVDILLTGFQANKELKKPPSFLRGHYFLLYREQRRVTAFLTLIECFLQDAPQFSLQVYIWTVQNRTSTRLFLKNFHYMQYASIAFSLATLCYSVVSYHQTLRYTRRHVLPMSFNACIAQFTWRLGTTGSRLLVIMFAVTAYPYATLIIIASHWGLMILWLMTQQNTNVLITKFTSTWAELLYNILMGGIHIFCFLNVFVNQTRYRLILFYVVQFMEDFAFLCLWYVQLLMEPVHYHSWIYHLGAAIYFNAFAVGIAAMVAFYLILHPNMTGPLTEDASPHDKTSHSILKLLTYKFKSTKKHICIKDLPHNNSECWSDHESLDAEVNKNFLGK